MLCDRIKRTIDAKLCVPQASIATRQRTLFEKHAAQRFCLPDRSVRDVWNWADEEIA